MNNLKALVQPFLKLCLGIVIAGSLFFGNNQCFAQAGKSKKVLPIVAFQQKPGELKITVDGKPFASYIYEDETITRPFFAHVKSACGIQVTRNHPPQEGDPKDHATFHPGIWLSFGDISSNDYWRLKCKVEHEMFTEKPQSEAGRGTFAVRNYYLSPDGKDRLLAEVARYTISVKPEGVLLTVNSSFSSDTNHFIFGDQEEMGLGVRVNTGITVQYGNGHITNAEGLKDGDGTWGKASKWVDYSGVINNQRVGVLVMPDPSNLRPSWFHTRDYGLMAANLFGRDAMKQGEKSAIRIEKGETFEIGYGLLVYCTPADQKPDLEKAYSSYIKDAK